VRGGVRKQKKLFSSYSSQISKVARCLSKKTPSVSRWWCDAGLFPARRSRIRYGRHYAFFPCLHGSFIHRNMVACVMMSHVLCLVGHSGMKVHSALFYEPVKFGRTFERAQSPFQEKVTNCRNKPEFLCICLRVVASVIRTLNSLV